MIVLAGSLGLCEKYVWGAPECDEEPPPPKLLRSEDSLPANARAELVRSRLRSTTPNRDDEGNRAAEDRRRVPLADAMSASLEGDLEATSIFEGEMRKEN